MYPTKRDRADYRTRASLGENMAGEKRSGQDRRSHSTEQINALVESRARTLVLYAELRKLPKDNGIGTSLQRFCQSLIDYTASAHFQLYRHLDENEERRRSVIEVADAVFPRISETTDYILEFNDKYDIASYEETLGSLEDDLIILGEVLVDRVQLEDRVIHALTAEHRRSPGETTH